jgi:hypothetical protein
MRTFNYTLVNPTAMTTDITSPTVLLNSILLLSIQASWTGAPVGTLKLQASNDLENSPTQAWSDVAASSFNVNGAGDILYNLSEIGYCRMRLVYTRSSGSGTLRVTANGKGI